MLRCFAALFDGPLVSLIWLLAVQRDAPPASVRGEPVEPGNAPSDVTLQARIVLQAPGANTSVLAVP